MTDTSFLTEQEVKKIGFKSIGSGVKISRFAHFYGASDMVIGNDVRIDDFCILSGNIRIANNVHIAAYSALYGGCSGIFVDEFANVSSRVCIYAVSDDYSGNYMTNPTVPDELKKVTDQKTSIGKHVIIGTGCTVLPGATLEEGTAVGAMSLIKTSTEAWHVYAGIPAKKISERAKRCLDLEKEYKENRR